LASILGLALWQARGRPYLLVGWLWFLGTLVPVLGLVEVGSHLLADRYTYWPHIGLLVMVAWGTADLLAGRNGALVRVALAGAAAIACLVVARHQLAYWHDSETLWVHGLEVTADNWLAHNNRGTVLLARGQVAEAVAEFHEALRLCPTYGAAHSNLGAALYHQGRVDEAVDQLTRAVQLDPRNAAGHLKLGLALQRQGRFAEALGHDEEALCLDPRLAEAHNQRGMVLESQGHGAEAIACYRQAVRLEPRAVKYRCNLASALYDQGQAEAARGEYCAADRLCPNWPAAANQVAWSLATAADARRRFGALAVRLARQACQGTGYRRPEFLATLAIAYAEAGRFAEAARTAQEAQALAGTTCPPEWVGQLPGWLDQYRCAARGISDPARRARD
jgi:tetratricopeptide (TPR) repeat protein